MNSLRFTRTIWLALFALLFSNAQAQLKDLAAVYETAQAAAVRIETRPFGIGSGFFIAPNGLVMTAYHVVQGAGSFEVVTSEGARFTAELIGFDEFLDLAVLQARVEPPVPFLRIAKRTPTPGDTLIAIGNSRGDFNAVHTGEAIRFSKSLSAFLPTGMLSSTLNLAPGDSGGPWLNAEGQVVGVTIAISHDESGFASHATPVAGRQDLVQNLIAGLRREVPFLGIRYFELSPEAVADLGFGRPGAILIIEVLPGSGAEAAGLKNPEFTEVLTPTGPQQRIVQADLLIAIDGVPLQGAEQLVRHLRSRKVGDTVRLTIQRGDEILEVEARLGTRSSVLNTQ